MFISAEKEINIENILKTFKDLKNFFINNNAKYIWGKIENNIKEKIEIVELENKEIKKKLKRNYMKKN